MSDPLSEVVRLLQPHSVFTNPISGTGNWSISYSRYGKPSFCIMLQGCCSLEVDGHEPITIGAGDFVLLPATPPFTISGGDPVPSTLVDPETMADGMEERRYGNPDGEAEMRSLGGAFLFENTDPQLLIALLPPVVHVKNSARLARLVGMVGEEFSEQRPGREFMLSHLMGLMLVEAMRSSTSTHAPPGLLRGLGDERLAPALKKMHESVSHPWTVSELAAAAALSRSAFFDRFSRTVGVAPMAYLLSWRTEIAKDLLRRERLPVAHVAERVGYASTSTFSAAFSRQVGLSPSRYAASAPS
jgi:AraC-like DNA-binding protein